MINIAVMLHTLELVDCIFKTFQSCENMYIMTSVLTYTQVFYVGSVATTLHLVYYSTNVSPVHIIWNGLS